MEEKPKGKSWISNLLFEEDHSQQEGSPEEAVPLDPEPVRPVLPALRSTPPEAEKRMAVTDSSALNFGEIYKQAGIPENAFATPEQVLELQATFSDLPLEMQKQKVLKTLSSFKVDVSSIVENTQAKTAAITNYLQGIQSDAQSTIEASTQAIDQLQAQIDSCRSRITEAQSLWDQTKTQCGREISRLKEVLDFLGIPASFDASPDRRLK
jgi:hypothetical protein